MLTILNNIPYTIQSFREEPGGEVYLKEKTFTVSLPWDEQGPWWFYGPDSRGGFKLRLILTQDSHGHWQPLSPEYEARIRAGAFLERVHPDAINVGDHVLFPGALAFNVQRVKPFHDSEWRKGQWTDSYRTVSRFYGEIPPNRSFPEIGAHHYVTRLVMN